MSLKVAALMWATHSPAGMRDKTQGAAFTSPIVAACRTLKMTPHFLFLPGHGKTSHSLTHKHQQRTALLTQSRKLNEPPELPHTCNTTQLLEHILFGTALHFILDRPGCCCTPHRLFCTNTLTLTSFVYTAPLPYMTTTHIDDS